MGEKYRERLLRLESILSSENAEIDLDSLRSCCSQVKFYFLTIIVNSGIPDSHRPLCWRILLGYLPLQLDLWLSHSKKQREIYLSLVDDIIVHPGHILSSSAQGVDVDHPLNSSPNSEWHNYFKDNEVLVQIDKDVRRLCPEIDFFQRTTSYPHRSAAKINLSRRICQVNLHSEVPSGKKNFKTGHFIISPNKKAKEEYSNIVDENVEYHWQVVERVLFIYSKLNPGIKYVQGMNEVVGPLYYVFANDPNPEWAKYAEADTYYCFQLLMSEIKDNFIKTLDNSTCGIESFMNRFYHQLQEIDSQLYNHLSDLAIKPQFYAFRWLSLLLSQEFSLPDVINIWDSVFSSKNYLCFLHWVCLAMMESIRDQLLMGDFSFCLKMLQNYHGSDVGQLIMYAHELSDGRSIINSAHNSSKDTSWKPELNATKFATAFSNVFKSFSKK